METYHLRTLASTRAELLLQIQVCKVELRFTEDETSDKHSTIKERLTALRRQLNATSPVVHLHPEVLGAISRNYVLDHWDVYSSQTKAFHPSNITPYSWFVVLHICHHWRHVALSTPALWTHVVPTNEQCVEFVLSKSGHLPLTALSPNNTILRTPKPNTRDRRGIHVSIPGITEVDAYGSILKRLPRIRIAKLSAHRDSGLSHTGTLSNDPEVAADLLEELCLDMGPYTTDQQASVFASRAMHNLRFLRVIGGTLGIVQSLLRSSLTTLDATLVRAKLTGSTLDDFVVALSQLPSLQHITLRSHTWTPRDVIPTVLPPPQHIASFPQLKYISLEGPALGLAELVHCLVFPSDTVIRLQSMSAGSTEENQLALSALLPKVVGSAVRDPENGAPGPRFRPRSLLFDNQTLNVSLWRSVQSWPRNDDEIFAFEAPDLQMFIPIDDNDQVVVADFMAALDLTEVVTMNFRLGIRTDVWISIFAGLVLPELESIRVSSNVHTSMLLKAMTTPLREPQPSAEEDSEVESDYYLFPDLKRLVLDTLTFRRERWCSPWGGDFFATVTDSLQLRAERVRKLEQLLLIRPINLLPYDYQALDSGRYAQSYEVYDPITNDPEDDSEAYDSDAEVCSLGPTVYDFCQATATDGEEDSLDSE